MGNEYVISTVQPLGILDEASLDPANMSSGSATVGQVPVADGGGGIDWSDEAGLGDVTGPASATNNGIAVYNGTTGKVIKAANAAVDFGAQDIANVGSIAGHVPITRQIIDGTGITGGGDLSTDRTLSVVQSALDPANMDSGSVTNGQVPTADGLGGIAWADQIGDVDGPSSALANRAVVFDGATGKLIKEPDAAIDFGGQNLINLGSIAGYVPATRQIGNGTGITGGGDLSADRTLSVVQSALDPANMASGSATSGQVPIASGGGAIAWGDAAAVLVYATEAALLAATPADSSIAYAQDTDRFFFRKNGAWVARGVFVATDTVSAPGTGAYSEKFGASTTAAGTGAIAIGYGADAGEPNSIAIGYNTSILTGGTNSVMIGANRSHNRANCVSVGILSAVNGADSVAIGEDTTVYGQSVVIGHDCTTYIESVAIGQSGLVDQNYCVGIGQNITVRAASGIGIGHDAIVADSGNEGIAIGRLSRSYDTGGIALGYSAQINSNCEYGIAIGHGSTHTGVVDSITVGRSATATHANAVAVGRSAATTAANRCTIGTIAGSYDKELQLGLGLAVWGGTPPASQSSKINDPSGGTTIDSEARTAINAIIDVLEVYGLSSAT